MVFNATFNNISVLSWRSVSLVEETGVPGENDLPQVGGSSIRTLYLNVNPTTILEYILKVTDRNLYHVELYRIQIAAYRNGIHKLC